jgi:DNA end-binding protein Ku
MTAARSMGSFTLNFGMVAIPVQLFASVSEAKSKLTRHQLHRACGARLNQVMKCPTHGIVEKDDIVKGHEYAKDQYVIISDEDLDTLPVGSKESATIDAFVPADAIDPCRINKTYYLQAGKGGQAAFNLLVAGLAATGSVGIAKFSLRSQREVLAAVTVTRGVLFLHTLFYESELRVALDAPLPTVGEKELAMATQLIGMYQKPFDATEHEDGYYQAFEALVARRLADPSYQSEAPAPTPKPALDLTAALAASLAAKKKAA